MRISYLIDKYNDYKVNGVPRWIKSIFSITFTSLLIAILVLLTTTIFAQKLTPDNFGYVSSYRRLCNLLSAIITGGFIISIPRYISFFHNKSRSSEQATIFLSVTTSIAIFLFVSTFLWIFKEPLTHYLGGGKDTVTLIWGISLLLLTLVAEATIYAIFQGYQSLFRGNFLYMCSFGLIPFVYALNVNTSLDAKTIILWLAIIRLIFIAPIISFFYIRSVIAVLKTWEEVKKLYKEFLYFSFSRAIGGFGMMGIVSIGPILALSFASSADAGYLEISQNIISIIASLSIGVNIGLLTHISKLSSESEVEQIRNKVIITEKIALFIGIYLFLTIALFAKEIIVLWVGAKYLPSILIIQISLIAIIPYSIYTFLRGIIDADNIKPINTIITIVSFVEIIVLSIIMVHLKFGIYGIVLSLLVGYLVLGLLTVIYTHRTYSVSFKLLGIWNIIFVNLLLFIFVALEKFIFNDNIWFILILNTIIIVLAVVIYIKKPEIFLNILKVFRRKPVTIEQNTNKLS